MVECPEEYFWSSCRFYVKNSRAPEWLGWEEALRGHGGTMRTARREYQGYLQEGLSCPPASPLAGTVAGTLFGSEGFVEKMRNWLQDRLPGREAPAARELGLQIKPESVETAMCRTFGISRESLRERRKRGNEGRAVAVYLCRKLTGESIAVLGERFGGVNGQAISKTAVEVARRMEDDRNLERCVRACEAVTTGPQRS